MSQNRPPPAYQEYAAEMLANINFRLLSASQRGVLWTIRLECWRNKKLPSTPEQLALLTGLSVNEFSNALETLERFNLIKVDGGFIYCQDLEDYRQSLLLRKLKQSEGGKKGARSTNRKKRETKNNNNLTDKSSSTTPGNPETSLPGNSNISERVISESLDKTSIDKSSLEKISNQREYIPGVDDWFEDDEYSIE